jgi:RNA ligase
MTKLTDIIKGGLCQIQANIDAGLISKRKHPQLDYWILNYTHKTQIDWVWNQVTTVCRGLIVDDQWNIIARPFKKFFTLDQWQTFRNSVHHLYDVKYSKMFDGPFDVYCKLDGSLGILFQNPQTSKYEMASRGSFESEQAIKATEILQRKYPDISPFPGITYLFEIIYPENKIVVDYGDEEDLILLGCIDNETGKEIDIDYYHEGYTNLWGKVKRAERFLFDDWRDLDKLNWKNSEGFVIRFLDNDIRVKIKFEEYKSLHKILNGLNEKLVFEWTKNNFDYSNVIEKLPLDKQEWVKELIFQYNNKFLTIYNEARYLVLRDGRLNRKEFARLHKDRHFSSVLFAMLDGKKWEEAIWKIIEKDIGGQATLST